MLGTWTLWRLTKFIGFGLLTAGLAGSAVARDPRRRTVSVHLWATLGLALTWIAGYAMTKSTGVTIREPWILIAIAGSLFALHEAAALAHRAKAHVVNFPFMVVGWSAALGSMVVRTAGPGQWVAVLAMPLTLGLLAHLIWRRMDAPTPPDGPTVQAEVQRWFTWIARLEGLSLLALFGLYMPAKYALDIQLDGGQGWFGWVHGVMVLIFMQALWSAWRVLGWGLGRTALGFLASFVPLGTFVFERRVFGASKG